MPIRRLIISTMLAVSAVAAAYPALAQQKDVPIAAVVPLSGPWARGGENIRNGAQLAIDDINASGGIKALNGAKLRLVVVDAGDSPDKARNAAQRVLSDEPNLVGGTGSWLSAFTLAVTEVTERAQLPFMTGSFGDPITARGFKYVFQVPAIASKISEQFLPVISKVAESATGSKPKSVGVITDSTPSPTAVLKPLREGGFQAAGMKVAVDETFTPPLSDATSVVQAVRAGRPEWLFLPTTTTQDTALVIQKLNEFGLGKGRLPIVANSGTVALPEIRNIVSADLMEGVMVVLGFWPNRNATDIVTRFSAKYNEPWMISDAIEGYADIQLFKEAIERAGSTDREKVAQVLRTIDITDGPAKYFAGGRVRFDEKGRRVDATIVVVQWQKGRPELVYPLDVATAKVSWPKQ